MAFILPDDRAGLILFALVFITFMNDGPLLEELDTDDDDIIFFLEVLNPRSNPNFLLEDDFLLYLLDVWLLVMECVVEDGA